MQLKEKVALVTGGSRGIGRGIVKAFVREGAKVAFVYRGNQPAADTLVKEISESGGTALAIQGDVAEADTAPRSVEQVKEKFGRLDILINNAGIIRDGLFVRMPEEDWIAVINTNLNGVFRFCRAVVEQMVFKQRSGRIINISSVAAEHVNAGQCNYAASKGAINAFTRAGDRSGLAKHYRQRDRSRVHRHGYERSGPQQGRRFDQKDDPGSAARATRGYRQRGGVPGQRRGLVHHRATDYGGRRIEPGSADHVDASWA